MAAALNLPAVAESEATIGTRVDELTEMLGLTAFRGAPRLVHAPGAARMEIASPLQGLELLVSVSWVCGRQVP